MKSTKSNAFAAMVGARRALWAIFAPCAKALASSAVKNATVTILTRLMKLSVRIVTGGAQPAWSATIVHIARAPASRTGEHTSLSNRLAASPRPQGAAPVPAMGAACRIARRPTGQLVGAAACRIRGGGQSDQRARQNVAHRTPSFGRTAMSKENAFDEDELVANGGRRRRRKLEKTGLLDPRRRAVRVGRLGCHRSPRHRLRRSERGAQLPNLHTRGSISFARSVI